MTRNSIAEGLTISPFSEYRYDRSSSALPLTVTWPLTLQQATVSPGMPITRLMR